MPLDHTTFTHPMTKFKKKNDQLRSSKSFQKDSEPDDSNNSEREPNETDNLREKESEISDENLV